MKDLSTPLIDAAREQREAYFAMVKARPPLRWYTLSYWRVRFFWWRHGF
jgi:hypothetical protein